METTTRVTWCFLKSLIELEGSFPFYLSGGPDARDARFLVSIYTLEVGEYGMF